MGGALVVAMAWGMVAPAVAATRTVQVEDFSFTPATSSGAAGDTVRWEKAGGTFPHNVSSTSAMFRSGAATGSAFTFTRTFSAGTYPYVCEIHADSGMTGVVRIRPRVAAGPTGLPFTVRWATTATNTGDTFRVQYRVNGGDWRGWFSGTPSNAKVFGANNSPVKVVAGATYRFRARSIRNGNLSGYSPAVAFTP